MEVVGEIKYDGAGELAILFLTSRCLGNEAKGEDTGVSFPLF